MRPGHDVIMLTIDKVLELIRLKESWTVGDHRGCSRRGVPDTPAVNGLPIAWRSG